MINNGHRRRTRKRKSGARDTRMLYRRRYYYYYYCRYYFAYLRIVLTDGNGERGEFAGVRDHGRNGHGQHDAGTGTDPQQVFDRQQRRDPKTRRLVLPYDVVAACGSEKQTVR